MFKKCVNVHTGSSLDKLNSSYSNYIYRLVQNYENKS